MEKLRLEDIEIELRPCVKADIGFVYELMYNGLGSLFNLHTQEKWSRFKFKKTFNPSKITIFEHDEMPIGFIHLNRFQEEVYCGGLHLSEDYQNRGLGKAILSYFFSQCLKEGYKYLTGKVFKNNRKSISLINRVGFTLEKEMPEENSYFVRRTLA